MTLATLHPRLVALTGAILMIAAVPALAQSGPESAAPPPDFRHVRWGMSEADVRATEAKAPAEERDADGERLLIYNDASAHADRGSPALVVYGFTGGRLERAKRIFTTEHPGDVNGFVTDFRKEEAALAHQHGEPDQDRALWLDDSLQEERIAYLEQDRARATSILASDRFAGVAVSLGQLKLYVARCTGRTEILHTLTGAEAKVTHQVEYRRQDRASCAP